MKLTWTRIIFTVAAIGAFSGILPAGARADAGDEVVPLIVIDNVPLLDAIRNLARHMGGNYIIDPRVGGPSAPAVSLRAGNVSAREALGALLAERKLVLVTNPVTTVARIAPASLGVKPVPASQVGTNLGSVIPLMALDDVPLPEAIGKLAVAAALKISPDPKLEKSMEKARVTVSFRWEKITARQALAALLDNHDLLLVEDPATGVARIVVRMPRGTDGTGKTNPEKKQP